MKSYVFSKDDFVVDPEALKMVKPGVRIVTEAADRDVAVFMAFQKIAPEPYSGDAGDETDAT